MPTKSIAQTLKSNYGVSKKAALFISLSPIILTLAYNVLLVMPSYRSFAFWLQEENSPIELLTFIFFLTGGVLGLYFTFKFIKHNKKSTTIFYVFFSICLLIIAMEEIAWGQWFFFFDTPENWKEMNTQGETTIHNLKGFHGHNEILRFLFGFCGITGVFLGKFEILKKISANVILIPWFIIVVFHSIADIFTNSENISYNIYRALQTNSELVEMLISVSAFLYLWLNFRLIKKLSSTNS